MTKVSIMKELNKSEKTESTSITDDTDWTSREIVLVAIFFRDLEISLFRLKCSGFLNIKTHNLQILKFLGSQVCVYQYIMKVRKYIYLP